ncbi:hypothetical protein TIFTF001_012694 [Ficus carica]|uniref:Uncharacterized protein n=1 Tax=Ficus carica TaxID=3494 RepID=A0AA88A2U8_FICCA|nr:hypothetical protein TIFTF001_012694 [Ficus carica]
MASFMVSQRLSFFFTIMVMTLLSLMAILLSTSSTTTAVRSYTLEQPPVGVDYDSYDLRAASDQTSGTSSNPPGPPHSLQAVGKGRGEPPNSGPSHRGNKAPTFTPSKH